MANVPASAPYSRSQHATLTANVVDVVTLDKAYPYVEILNRDSTNPLYVVVTRGANNETTIPLTIAGPGTYYVGPGAVRVVRDDTTSEYLTTTPLTVVQILSAGAASYSVTGMQPTDVR